MRCLWRNMTTKLLQVSWMMAAAVILCQQGSDHISLAPYDDFQSLEQIQYSEYALLQVAICKNAGNVEVLGQLVALEHLLGVQRLDLNSAVLQNAVCNAYILTR
ncbi:hypothetical protein MP228_009702 [Amoeboaphelidium protococcarum]|nr:hypothetical protein MP228_009702 [Amoeboaphelidium protococcarum]